MDQYETQLQKWKWTGLLHPESLNELPDTFESQNYYHGDGERLVAITNSSRVCLFQGPSGNGKLLRCYLLLQSKYGDIWWKTRYYDARLDTWCSNVHIEIHPRWYVSKRSKTVESIYETICKNPILSKKIVLIIRYDEISKRSQISVMIKRTKLVVWMTTCEGCPNMTSCAYLIRCPRPTHEIISKSKEESIRDVLFRKERSRFRLPEQTHGDLKIREEWDRLVQVERKDDEWLQQLRSWCGKLQKSQPLGEWKEWFKKIMREKGGLCEFERELVDINPMTGDGTYYIFIELLAVTAMTILRRKIQQ